MSTFFLYLIGFTIFVGGLAYGAFLLGLQLVWIATAAITLMGLGIVVGVGKTRQKDAPPASE